MSDLILGSSSPYRRQLLEQIQCKFTVVKPEVDETRLEHEPIAAYVERISRLKVAAIQAKYPEATIIASDQAMGLGEHIFGKPGNLATAKQMLQQISGQTLLSYTGLAMVVNNKLIYDVTITEVEVRDLNDAMIDHYLSLEPDAVNCAGCIKAEALGIVLLKAIRCDDPSALIGLPLMRITEILNTELGDANHILPNKFLLKA